MTTEQRLEKLERELFAALSAQQAGDRQAKRRNRWTLTFAALVLVAMGCRYNNNNGRSITGVQDEIKAQRFTVVDAQGDRRAVLGVLPDGISGLSMLDAQGQARAGLAVAADGAPGLVMADAQGKGRAVLFVDADGISGLSMLDVQGKTRAMLFVDADGTAALGMSDAQGRPIWSAP